MYLKPDQYLIIGKLAVSLNLTMKLYPNDDKETLSHTRRVLAIKAEATMKLKKRQLTLKML